MRDAYDEAMAGVLDRIAREGRDEDLFGGKLDRAALELFHRFSTQTAKPVGLIEIPLLDVPGFDVGIGSYRGQLEPGIAFAGPIQLWFVSASFLSHQLS